MLSGIDAGVAQEALKILHSGIDVGNKAVTETHNFEEKLMAIDAVMGHLYLEYKDTKVYEFFEKVLHLILTLKDELAKLKKAEIHIVKKAEASSRKRPKWLAKHIKKVHDQVEDEENLLKETLELIHGFLQDLKELFQQSNENFKLSKGKVIVKQQMDRKDEVKHILENLFQFVTFYEELFVGFLKDFK